MLYDRLAQDLYTEICHIPLIDPHSHINPHQPTARSLDDILGYHYYTELAHSAGMPRSACAATKPDAENSYAERLGELVNQYREQRGARPLRVEGALSALVLEHSNAQLDGWRRSSGHDRSESTSPHSA